MFPVACCPKSNTRGGAPAFVPTDIASLAEWWSITSLAAVGDGNPIDSWVGEKAVYTVSATTTARPTYDANDGDGKPAAQFDGVDDVLGGVIDNTVIYGSGTYELWFVVKGLSSGAGSRGFFGTNNMSQARWTRVDTSPKMEVQLQATGSPVAASGSLDVQDDGWHVVRLVQSGTTYKFYLDGSLINADGPFTFSVPSGNDQLKIGISTSAGPAPWNGGIRHVMAFNDALSAENAAALQTYLEGFV